MRITVHTTRLLVGGASALVAMTMLAGCGSSSEEDSSSAPDSTPTASATAGSPSASVTAPGERVLFTDLAAVVSDRTFTGTFDGVPYAEYYAPNGTLRGEEDGEAYTGTWAVVGDELCFTYPDAAGGPAEVDCYEAYRDGEEITWVDREGNVTAATWEEGNPRGL